MYLIPALVLCEVIRLSVAAGIHTKQTYLPQAGWIPAFAGMRRKSWAGMR